MQQLVARRTKSGSFLRLSERFIGSTCERRPVLKNGNCVTNCGDTPKRRRTITYVKASYQPRMQTFPWSGQWRGNNHGPPYQRNGR